MGVSRRRGGSPGDNSSIGSLISGGEGLELAHLESVQNGLTERKVYICVCVPRYIEGTCRSQH